MTTAGFRDQILGGDWPLGAGTRLFDEDAPVKLSLARSESYDNGVVYLAYRLQS